LASACRFVFKNQETLAQSIPPKDGAEIWGTFWGVLEELRTKKRKTLFAPSFKD